MSKKVNDNMSLWNSVCETDPQFTKTVNQRGGFTAIGAQSQLMKATEIFGAMGTGWGVKTEHIEKWEDVGLVIYQATLWYMNSKGEQQYIPIHSSIRYVNNNRVDDDFFKKVATDALTKGFSKLGFNADVFMGRFDDNKYVTGLKGKYSKVSNKKDKQEESKLELDVQKCVEEALKGIPKADDFYVKVTHALEKGAISQDNLESSLEKISKHKGKLQLEVEGNTNG